MPINDSKMIKVSRNLDILCDYEKYLPEMVRIVAIEGAIGDWAAYLETATCENEIKSGREEISAIAGLGHKLQEDEAKNLFPSWNDRLKWRL